MKEQEFCDRLADAFSWYDESTDLYDRIETFATRKITTGAFGFVFVMRDGSEFQVSVVKSKLERPTLVSDYLYDNDPHRHDP